MAEDAYNVESRFVDLAASFNALRAGGEHFRQLAHDLISLAFRDAPFLEVGGLVVPQIGQGAGSELRSRITGNSHPADTPKAVADATSEFWQRLAQKEHVQQIAYGPLSQAALCLLQPIAHGFDRPIGYLYAVVQLEQRSAASSRLNYVTKYIATAVKAEKACCATELLSQPLSITQSSLEGIAQIIASACQQALSSEIVIVWIADKVRQVLRTTATADGANSKIRVDMSFGQGLAGKCFKDCAPVLVDDLLDAAEWSRLGTSPQHPDLIRLKNWRSAMLVPLDVGGQAAGVMSAYGPRPRGFSTIDKNILLAFAHRLSASYANFERIRHLTEMERKLETEAPNIEAGMFAMENIHDAVNQLMLAQDCLTRVISNSRFGKPADIAKESQTALALVASAKKGMTVFANRAKFTKIIPTSVQLKEVLQEAVNKVTLAAEDIAVRIQLQCPAELKVRIDRDKMYRVFVNLLDNSLWFLETDSKGEEKFVWVTTTLREDSIQILFKDNGPGIAPYNRDKVFDYSFTTKGDRGMGFGLGIARRIITAHGGRISVDSRWGFWTEILIALPLSIQIGDTNEP